MADEENEQEETDGIYLDWKDVENWQWTDFARRYIKRANMLGYDSSATSLFCKVMYLYNMVLPECLNSRFDDPEYGFPFSDDEMIKYPIFYTSQYGMRDNNVHYGADFGCPEGTPVRAVCDGTVTAAGGDEYDRSNAVICIQHDRFEKEEYSRYFHCSKILVSVGDNVQKGEIIGYSGNVASFTTGPHLHFELSPGNSLKSRSAVDPLTYFPKFRGVVKLGDKLEIK